MISFVRTLEFTPDKIAGILSMTRQMKRLLKTRYSVDLHAHLPIAGGSPNRIAFTAFFKSLADYEALMVRLADDIDYRRLIGANARNMLAGTTHDELWRDIEALSESSGH